MSAVQALALVVAVADLGLLVVLTVLLARADRLLAESRGLLVELSRRPGAAPRPPQTVAETIDPAPQPLVATPLAVVGAEIAVPEPTAGPTLREIATATLGPPLIRAAALGYGVRDVLADRSHAGHVRAPRGRRPRSRSTR